MILQKIGVGLLISTGFFGLIGQFGAGWAAYALTGLITLACAIRNKVGEPTRTVSQYIQDLTDKKWIDYIVGGVIIGFCIWQHFSLFDKINIEELSSFELGMIAAYWVLPMGLAIHFFANKD